MKNLYIIYIDYNTYFFLAGVVLNTAVDVDTAVCVDVDNAVGVDVDTAVDVDVDTAGCEVHVLDSSFFF